MQFVKLDYVFYWTLYSSNFYSILKIVRKAWQSITSWVLVPSTLDCKWLQIAIDSWKYNNNHKTFALIQQDLPKLGTIARIKLQMCKGKGDDELQMCEGMNNGDFNRWDLSYRWSDGYKWIFLALLIFIKWKLLAKGKHYKVGMESYSLIAHRVFGKIAIFFSFVGPSRPMANFGDN